MSGFFGGTIVTVTLTSSNLTAGIYTITGSRTVVQVRESNGYVVLPDNILQSGGNTLVTLSTGSFSAIPGTWSIEYI